MRALVSHPVAPMVITNYTECKNMQCCFLEIDLNQVLAIAAVVDSMLQARKPHCGVSYATIASSFVDEDRPTKLYLKFRNGILRE